MSSTFAILVMLTISSSGHDSVSPQEGYQEILTFEASHAFWGPGGWGGGPRETLFLDSLVVHGGRFAGRLERGTDDQGEYSTFTTLLPVTFSGDTLELRGWLRTDSVVGYAGFWLREDGKDGVLEFGNMAEQNLSGTTGWTRYSIVLPINDKTRRIMLGALLRGEGTVWIDDLELIVDGRPAAEAPPFDPGSNAIEADTEFDSGSRIGTESLSPLQVDNLTLLGKVWGFIKYHHPRVTAGKVNWDYELFRVAPAMLRSRDRTEARLLMAEWLDSLGAPEPSEIRADLPADAYLQPEIDWIHDSQALGMDLSRRLGDIYRNRSADGKHYYVGHLSGVGNPDFSSESRYSNMPLPDAGFRLLAVFRLWNIIEYWFPYRDVIGEDWSNVLAEFIPRVMAADSYDEYRLVMMRMTARINDTHANTWGVLNLRPPTGSAQIPVNIRFIEGETVVTGFIHPVLGPASGLEIGDVIRTIDGRATGWLVTVWEPFYAASNQPTRLRDIGRALSRGEAGPVRVTGVRSTGPFQVDAERIPLSELDLAEGRTHDRPGETFQMLTEEVAYLKLSSVETSKTADYIRQAAGSKVLVIDIRNYPSEFVVFSLGGHFVREETPFARFTRADAANPGAFLMSEPVTLRPIEPYYPGKVVILLDEVSQSQAEYTAMAFRASANAIVVGSTTAGADGNISPIPLPGGFNAMISGIGVFYPDGQPTQRIGILPDLEVHPTIAGIQAGQDEVLEAGISRALDPESRLAPPGTASTGSFHAEYAAWADVTGDGISERLSVTAAGEVGAEWDDLLVRLEIRSDTDNLLFADEWSSEYWCNGYAFFETREVSVEEWVRAEMRHVVDPEHFMLTGEFGRRNASIMNNRREVGYGVRSDQYEQLWRAKYDIPIHEHICNQPLQRQSEIRAEFRAQISDEKIEQLMEEVAEGPTYMYRPGYDAMYILAWIRSEERFALVIHP